MPPPERRRLVLNASIRLILDAVGIGDATPFPGSKKNCATSE